MEQLLKANGKIQIAICRDSEKLIEFVTKQLPSLELGRVGPRLPNQVLLEGSLEYIEFLKVEKANPLPG